VRNKFCQDKIQGSSKFAVARLAEVLKPSVTKQKKNFYKQPTLRNF
jgi:hypothetical protein